VNEGSQCSWTSWGDELEGNEKTQTKTNFTKSKTFKDQRGEKRKKGRRKVTLEQLRRVSAAAGGLLSLSVKRGAWLRRGWRISIMPQESEGRMGMRLWIRRQASGWLAEMLANVPFDV